MNTPWNDERANVDANNKLTSKLTLGSSQENSVATKQQNVVYHHLESTDSLFYSQRKAAIREPNSTNPS